MVRPFFTFRKLLEDPRKHKFGFYALCISATLYTFVYINLSIGGGSPSSFTPWLAIPKEDYYFYNQFMLAPSMLICWIAAAGIIQLLSRVFGGAGSYEDTLCVLGFSISIACLASLLHDLPDSFLGAIGVIDLKEYEVALNSPTIWRTILWAVYSTSVVLFILLFSKAVHVVHKLRPLQSAFTGLTAYAVYQVLFVVFNR